MSDKLLSAKITVEYIVKDFCEEDDIDEPLEEFLAWLIEEEGLFNIVDDESKVIKIESILLEKGDE